MPREEGILLHKGDAFALLCRASVVEYHSMASVWGTVGAGKLAFRLGGVD